MPSFFHMPGNYFPVLAQVDSFFQGSRFISISFFFIIIIITHSVSKKHFKQQQILVICYHSKTAF